MSDVAIAIYVMVGVHLLEHLHGWYQHHNKWAKEKKDLAKQYEDIYEAGILNERNRLHRVKTFVEEVKEARRKEVRKNG